MRDLHTYTNAHKIHKLKNKQTKPNGLFNKQPVQQERDSSSKEQRKKGDTGRKIQKYPLMRKCSSDGKQWSVRTQLFVRNETGNRGMRFRSQFSAQVDNPIACQYLVSTSVGGRGLWSTVSKCSSRELPSGASPRVWDPKGFADKTSTRGSLKSE